MSEFYLILHRVRGKTAFDVAIKGICPVCQEYTSVTGKLCKPTISQVECEHCGGEGFVWELPTIGHGARPFMTWPITELSHGEFSFSSDFTVPYDWPDHYQINKEEEPLARTRKGKSAKGSELIAKLGIKPWAGPQEEERRA